MKMENGMSDSCPRCDRIEKWIDHAGCEPNKAKRYEVLLEFVKWVSSRGCCNVCSCMSCEAVKVLRELGLSNTPE